MKIGPNMASGLVLKEDSGTAIRKPNNQPMFPGDLVNIIDNKKNNDRDKDDEDDKGDGRKQP